MMHSPELMLLLHNVDRTELYAELRDRARRGRPSQFRRAWSAVARTVAARVDLRRPALRPADEPDCAARCAA
jgi:hypothetical protein